MTEQAVTALIGLAGAALVVIGGIVGAIITARAQRRVGDIAARAATGAAKRSSEEVLIDQLQEELARFRDATDKRLEKLELENREYRRFLFIHRDLLADNGLPSPPWPDTIPR